MFTEFIQVSKANLAGFILIFQLISKVEYFSFSLIQAANFKIIQFTKGQVLYMLFLPVLS